MPSHRGPATHFNIAHGFALHYNKSLKGEWSHLTWLKGVPSPKWGSSYPLLLASKEIKKLSSQTGFCCSHSHLLQTPSEKKPADTLEEAGFKWAWAWSQNDVNGAGTSLLIAYRCHDGVPFDQHWALSTTTTMTKVASRRQSAGH